MATDKKLVRERWFIRLFYGIIGLLIGYLIFIDKSELQQIQVERDQFRDSLAVLRYQNTQLQQELVQTQKTKVYEIRAVDRVPVDSLLRYLANYPYPQ